jgi:hypothetical protein
MYSRTRKGSISEEHIQRFEISTELPSGLVNKVITVVK